MRSDAEIQAIIDDPKYAGWTKKDFRKAGILTRTETERKKLKFQHYGKKKDPTKVRKAQTKRTEQTKATSNVTTEQKLAAPKKSGLELSHLGSKKSLVTPNNLAYLPKYTNKLSYFRFEKILNGIQADQQKILADTTMGTADKRKALAELAKADRTLRNKFKGQGYDKIKSRIKTREFPWGMGETEIIRDSSITVGEGKAGSNVPLKTASKVEKGKIIKLGKENLEKVKTFYNDSPDGSDFRKGMDNLVKCANGCFVKVANKNPEKTLAKLNKEPQKLIRLFRGEEPARRTELYKDKKGLKGMYDESLKGRFFFDNPNDARWYAQRQGSLTGNVKSVDVPEKYVDIGRKMSERRRGPRYGSEVVLPKKFVGQETLNIPQTVMARAGAIKDKLKWNNIRGAFETAEDTVASQADIKTWAADNPMDVKVGTEIPKPNKSVLKTVGKTLAHIGAPLPTALIDGYFINKQMDEGKSTAEIAKDPLNWLGLATMEPLTKMAGVAEKGGLNAVLRLGLNPATIRGITRFAGLPGLAISTAMTAYDQYKKYQNEEGFVYNLFNKEGT